MPPREPLRNALLEEAFDVRPPVHMYPLHVTLSPREMRTLIAAESAEALQLTRDAGLEVPHDSHH
jgi:hypothetical protein